jgi:UDP-N-acetylglucosamine 2-epimerase (non-hydrolysing)
VKIKKLLIVGGTRPNFIKISALFRELRKYPQAFQLLLVHTGQHYDYRMSAIFFKELDLPEPDIYLRVGSGTHSQQTARIMAAFEKVCLRQKPDLVVVVGDVNSTVACAVVAAKLSIPLAHVEAGLRSFDRTMPEEINRIVTDAFSDFLFITEENARKNLFREGIDIKKIFFVGNTMIDTLKRFLPKARRIGFRRKNYALVTLHRSVNVDYRAILKKNLKILEKIAQKIPVVFPLHPRTKKQMEEFGLKKYFKIPGLKITAPLGYLDFLNLMTGARLVLTDSGGIQEETTVLGIPCLTLRKNTERPVTIAEGTNVLVGDNYDKIMAAVEQVLSGNYKKGRIPKFWDGRAARRIVRVLKKINFGKKI